MTLMLFGTKWCSACKSVKPICEEVAKEQNISFEYIDSEESADKVSKYGVRHAPTIIAENGEKMEACIDFQPKEKIEAMIEAVR